MTPPARRWWLWFDLFSRRSIAQESEEMLKSSLEGSLLQGMSMTKLHIKSEVAYSTVRRLFRDPFAEVTTATINRLADAPGVPPSHLLEDVPDE